MVRKRSVAFPDCLDRGQRFLGEKMRLLLYLSAVDRCGVFANRSPRRQRAINSRHSGSRSPATFWKTSARPLLRIGS